MPSFSHFACCRLCRLDWCPIYSRCGKHQPRHTHSSSPNRWWEIAGDSSSNMQAAEQGMATANTFPPRKHKKKKEIKILGRKTDAQREGLHLQSTLVGPQNMRDGRSYTRHRKEWWSVVVCATARVSKGSFEYVCCPKSAIIRRVLCRWSSNSDLVRGNAMDEGWKGAAVEECEHICKKHWVGGGRNSTLELCGWPFAIWEPDEWREVVKSNEEMLMLIKCVHV